MLRPPRSRRRLCAVCRERPATFRRPDGRCGRERHHDLCRECYDRECSRLRAWGIAQGLAPQHPQERAVSGAVSGAEE